MFLLIKLFYCDNIKETVVEALWSMKFENILVIICVVIGVAVAFAGCSVATRKHKMNNLIAQVFDLPKDFSYTAHTGCAGTQANSLDSIDTGAKYGAGIVEFDLNFNKNGDPVLAHDAPKGGEVTLDEAFKKISEYENIRVNVDIKSTVALEKIRPAAEKYGVAERIFYTGVHDGFVDAVRADGGDVDYYLNVNVKPKSKHTEEYLMSLVRKVKDSGAIGINFNQDNASKALVDTFHENGLLVSIWTVDKKFDMYRILSYGPDNITTRYPDMLGEIIQSLS